MLGANLTLVAADLESGWSWGGPVEPWEFHPMLIHFPIAFLLAGAVIGLYARWCGRSEWEQLATGLLIVGLLTGVGAALAGLLAMYTAPDNTEVADRLTDIHLWVQLAALLLLALACWLRWRTGNVTPSLPVHLIVWAAVVVLTAGSAIGGYMVYHAGAGIEPSLFAPAASVWSAVQMRRRTPYG